MSEQNVQTVKDIYASFGKGDIPAILAALTPETRLSHSGLPGTVPWASQTQTGPAEWGRFFGQLNELFEPESFEPEEYVAEGDRVVALGQFRFKARATGKSWDTHWAMTWKFQDGAPIDVRVYEDTEAQANALLP